MEVGAGALAICSGALLRPDTFLLYWTQASHRGTAGSPNMDQRCYEKKTLGQTKYRSRLASPPLEALTPACCLELPP